MEKILHYASVSLANFRGFKDEVQIPLAPLTFLVGPNSSGKSSIFDAILLIVQSGFQLNNPQSLDINWAGPLVDLGSFKDTVNKHNDKLTMEIGVKLSSEAQDIPRTFYFRSKPSKYRPTDIVFRIAKTLSNPLGQVTDLSVTDNLSAANLRLLFQYGKKSSIILSMVNRRSTWNFSEIYSPWIFNLWLKKEINAIIGKSKRNLIGPLSGWKRVTKLLTSTFFENFNSGIERVSSGRAKPSRWYPIMKVKYTPYRRSGEPSVFEGVDPRMIEFARMQERHTYGGRKYLEKRRGRVLEDTLKKLDIANKIKDNILSPYHSTIVVKDNRTGIDSNLMDVGYGASQVIPVILACSSYSSSPLFVEQPEIHLHPRAQAVVAELLCKTSSQRQIIIETHSEHMINRARIMIAQGALDASNVVINYIYRDRKGSHLLTIPILENGDFGAPWPEGFFDERYKDTLLLSNLQSIKEMK